jgi:hypothetical protein
MCNKKGKNAVIFILMHYSVISLNITVTKSLARKTSNPTEILNSQLRNKIPEHCRYCSV